MSQGGRLLDAYVKVVDKEFIDPLFLALPETERDALFLKASKLGSIAGRRLIVDAVIAKLPKPGG